MKLSEILPQLAAKFPAEAHKERQLPGGAGTWYYIPWTTIRQRLNEIACDNWSVSFDDPQFIGQLCYVRCTLTICQVSRQGIGAVPIEIISNSGKNAERGNAVERAIAESFKNAAEFFEIAAYLDEQTDDRTKKDFIVYMQRSGNGKPLAEYHKQQRQEQGIAETPKPKLGSHSKPFGQERLITPAQVTRFKTIARQAGYTTEGAKQLLAAHGFNSSKDITIAAYDMLCEKAGDAEYVALYNEAAEKLKQAEVAG